MASSDEATALARLRERAGAFTASDCEEAAANGQLECLKYAHEHGCPWDERRASMPRMHTAIPRA